jgi:translation initiation factor IF-1
VHLHRRDRLWQTDGVVREVLAGSFFRIEIAEGYTVLCRCNAKMALSKVGLTVGDEVVVEIPNVPGTKGRITFRYTGRNN